jgi:site-specific DNA-methyltransferase (adenine-specific)
MAQSAAAARPYYDDGTITIYHGDALAVLDELAGVVDVDVLVADPPYSSGGRTSTERTTKSTSTKYQQSDAQKKLPEFAGDMRDQHAHGYWCALWLSGALRLTRPGAIAFVWSDWRQLPTTTDALQAGGWTWRGITIWNKTTSRPSRGRFRMDAEFTAWGSHGDLPVHADVYPPSVTRAAPPRQREHIAQKPLEAYEHLLAIAPANALVLDPFTGTGSALLAARDAGHRAIGIEIDERYCEIAARRAAQP